MATNYDLYLTGGLIFWGCVFAGILWLHARREGRVDAVWRKVAKRLKFSFESHGPTSETRSISGTVQGCFVEIREDPTTPGARTSISVASSAIPSGLGLTVEGAVAGLRKALGAQDIQLGDPGFDERLVVTGPEVEALAALGQPARAALVSLAKRFAGLSLSKGKLQLLKAEELRDEAQLLELVRELADLGSLLSVSSVPEALAFNASHDDVASARRRNLLALAKGFAGDPILAKTAEAGVSDPDPDIRLAAARIIGGEREQAVLAALVDDAEAASELRAFALERLDAIATDDVVCPRLELALRSYQPPLLEAGMAVVARRRCLWAVGRLCELADSERARPAIAAAEALGELGDVRGQAPLLRLLTRQDLVPESADARLPAVVALGKLGTLEAVEPLLPLAQSVLPGALRDAAREAVRRIQAREGGAEAGRLSVVAADASPAAGLSLVDPSEERTEPVAPLRPPGRERG